MERKPITTDQAARLAATLHPMLGYLNRLRSRMEQVGFVSTDPLLQKVWRAADAVHTLWVEAHYRSCESGAPMEFLNRPAPGEMGPGENAPGPDH